MLLIHGDVVEVSLKCQVADSDSINLARLCAQAGCCQDAAM